MDLQEIALAGYILLSAIALLKGVDGVLLATCLGVLAGVFGFKIGTSVTSRKSKQSSEKLSR